MKRLVVVAILFVPVPAWTQQGSGRPVAPLTVEIVAAYPHSTEAFTQGLLHHGGWLFESTGLVGRSSVRRVELETGRVERQTDIPAPYFGEGLERVGDSLWALTWQHGTGFIYDRDTLEPTGRFSYDGEGWGLCFDGESLWLSNGSAWLSRRSPADFSESGGVVVTFNGAPLGNINELECVDGQVYANVWRTDYIVRIDPGDGVVTGLVDASSLHAELSGTYDVLNGIASAPEDGLFYVTGKLWPKLFAVRFVPAASQD